MALTIKLETENGVRQGDFVVDGSNATIRLAHEAQSAGSPLGLLQYVDPYGDTVFNELQMPTVLADLRRLCERARSEEDKAVLHKVKQLAMDCMNHHHLYLKFYGD